jgi:hypothetical protein
MAEQTAIQETAQALFCAMADFIGSAKSDVVFDLKKYPTYPIFKDNWDSTYKSASIDTVYKTKVDAPTVRLGEIEGLFQKDLDWYRSSVQIAKKLIHEIDKISNKFVRIKSPNWSDLFYARGDKDVMDNIGALFKIANDTQKKLRMLKDSRAQLPFGNINKWCPADIYFSSPTAKQEIRQMLQARRNTSMEFSDLNKFIDKLITSGELLPLSLKKQPKDVTIKLVNFQPSHEEKELSKYKFVRTNEWKPYTRTSPQTRDFQIFFDPTNPGRHIKMRHDASGAILKVEVQVLNVKSREGSIGSPDIFAELMMLSDPKSQGHRAFLKAYFDGNAIFKKYANEKSLVQLKTRDRKAFDDARGALSALHVTNAFVPVLQDWFRDTKRADRFVRLLFAYVTSRSSTSSKFVIAK